MPEIEAAPKPVEEKSDESVHLFAETLANFHPSRLEVLSLQGNRLVLECGFMNTDSAMQFIDELDRIGFQHGDLGRHPQTGDFENDRTVYLIDIFTKHQMQGLAEQLGLQKLLDLLRIGSIDDPNPPVPETFKRGN